MLMGNSEEEDDVHNITLPNAKECCYIQVHRNSQPDVFTNPDSCFEEY
jgi:hypothetical protein